MENDFLVSEGHRYRCDALATDSTFFQLFSYPLIQGEKNLTDPSSVVLTQSYAREVFGSDNPVGKTITYSNGQEYVVKGVIGLPVNKTWLNFDLLLANTSSNMWKKMPLDLYRFVLGADMSKAQPGGETSTPSESALSGGYTCVHLSFCTVERMLLFQVGNKG